MTLRNSLRSAFTLLEVILTLSMAVVLMSLVGATLQFYATNMNVRDTDVRRVHLATSVMQMIADDLRASLYGVSFDASALEEILTTSTQSQGGDAAAAVTGGGATEPTDDSTLTEVASTDLVASTTSLSQPGMIGNQFQIQFDISRLPRLEQWNQTLSATPGVLADVPSDVKTVTYYVQAPGTIAGVTDPLQGFLPSSDAGDQAVAAGGLVRRELDRAASNWAMNSGGLTGLLLTGDLIASEVLAISFEYFDGTIWQLDWNSDELESMPKAIRITLTMSDESAVVDPASLAVGTVLGTRTFTHIVQLPVGSVGSSTTETTAETSTSTDITTGTTSGATP